MGMCGKFLAEISPWQSPYACANNNWANQACVLCLRERENAAEICIYEKKVVILHAFSGMGSESSHRQRMKYSFLHK